jgi:ribosome recycling factor
MFVVTPDSIDPELILHSIRTTSLSQTIPAAQPLKLCRNFSHSSFLLKKKGKADREKEAAASEASGGTDDPFDFSTLESGIEKSLEKLKNDLSKLRTGGRFNSEILENVRVHLVKDIKSTERLGDLAQVLPKGGRSVMVLVGEKDVSYGTSLIGFDRKLMVK